jgi:hypothetical protein
VNPVVGLLLTLAALAVAAPATAGPWTLPKGDGQVIVKLEAMRADQGFDPNGDLLSLPAERRDTAVSLFAEYGLTPRLTVRLKGDWQSGEDAFVDYEGRGPLEVGLNWQVWRDDKTALALYGGVADGGEGRNAGYADPGIGGQDWEVRAALGRSFGPGRWMGPGATGGFVTLEAARRLRGGLPDETRVDATFGVHFGDKWMVLNQAYAGQADGGGPRWLSVETSLVRHFGPWAVQLGWREALSGRETPRSGGPVLGLWRRF